MRRSLVFTRRYHSSDGDYLLQLQQWSCIQRGSRAVQDHPGDPSNCGTVWRNAGTISDLPLDDFGVAHCSDDVTCCLVTVVAKVWFKDA